VKHATPVALDALEVLLRNLRAIDGLSERKRGVFYRGRAAFLHFHEDQAGFFADVKLAPGWVRFDVTTAGQRRELVREVRRFVGLQPRPQPRAAVPLVSAHPQPRAAVPRSRPRAAMPRAQGGAVPRATAR